ncbi:MAG: hypothetical protein AB8G17_16615 [Gammaproteobacteria bacterium]
MSEPLVAASRYTFPMTNQSPIERPSESASRPVIAAWVIAAIAIYLVFLWQTSDDRPPQGETITGPDTSESLSAGDATKNAMPAVGGGNRPATPDLDPDCVAHLAELDASPTNMDAINAQTLALEDSLRAFAEDLEKSNDPMDRLIAVDLVWGMPTAIRIEKTDAIKTLLPADPLVASAFFEACDKQPAHAVCADDRATKHLTDVDGDNGATWIRVGSQQLKNGDVDAAFDSLTRAVSASKYTSRVADWATTAERALRMAPNIRYKDRLGYALGVGTRHASPNFAPITEACETLAKPSPDWHKLCLQLGLTLENNATELAANRLGIDYQIGIYRLNGNVALIHDARKREQAIKIVRASAYRWSAEQFLIDNETALRPYLDAYAEGGERMATNFLTDQAIEATIKARHEPCYDQRRLDLILSR